MAVESRLVERTVSAGLSVLAALASALLFAHVGTPAFDRLTVWHAEHLEGIARAPLQYRWLSFQIPQWLTAIGLDLLSAYLLLRFVSLALAFWFASRIAGMLVRGRFAPPLMVVSLGLYYLASTQPYMQPAEEPNLLFFAVFIWLVLRGATVVPLALVMVAGALNKDTVGFLIPWVFLYRRHVQHDPRAAWRDAAVLGAVFTVVYIGLRLYWGTGRPYLGGLWQVEHNVWLITHEPLRGLMWTLPSLVPLLIVRRWWDRVPLAVRCFVPSLVLFVAGHWAISRIDEFRTYTPLALLMWPGVMALACDEFTRRRAATRSTARPMQP